MRRGTSPCTSRKSLPLVASLAGWVVYQHWNSLHEDRETNPVDPDQWVYPAACRGVTLDTRLNLSNHIKCRENDWAPWALSLKIKASS